MKNLRFVALVIGGLICLNLSAFGAGAEETTAEPVMEIVWQMSNRPGNSSAPPDGNPVELMIEERFNVSITPLGFTAAEHDKLMLYFASGNTADKLNLFPREDIYSFADQGLIRSVPKEWFWEYMPTWMAKVEEFFDRETLEKNMEYEGKYWGAPLGGYGDFIRSFWVARKDWMDNVGITKTPETVDEVTDMLRKFTFNDPDGNGKDDTYGYSEFSYNNAVWSKMNVLWMAYGTLYHSYEIRNGKVIFSAQTDEWKEALGKVAEWYSEGLIDPEFVTDNRDQLRAKWSAGKIGMMFDNAWWMVPSTTNNVLEQVTAKNPDAEFAFLPPPKGPAGYKGPASGQTLGLLTDGSPFFGRDTSDAKVKKIMDIIDYFILDQDFMITATHGKQGVHWDLNVNGLLERKEGVTDLDLQNFGARFYGMGPQSLTDKSVAIILSEGDREIYGFSESIKGNYPSDQLLGYPGQGALAQQKGPDILALMDEFYFNVAAGDLDLDAEWEDFQASLVRFGVEDIKAEYQAAYDSE